MMKEAMKKRNASSDVNTDDYEPEVISNAEAARLASISLVVPF